MEIETIQNALMTIRSECISHDGSCSSCPLRANRFSKCGVVGDVSGIGDYTKKPCNWKIATNITLFES